MKIIIYIIYIIPACIIKNKNSCAYVNTICYTLSGRIGKVVASHAAVARSIPLRCTVLYYARGAQGVLPMRVGGATSQLDLPFLTPLSIADFG